ncbi:MAG: hypothetical protein R2795_25295 [Saprospiraceae bacterium]
MKILKTFAMMALLLWSALAQSQSFTNCISATISVVGAGGNVLCLGDGFPDVVRFRASPLATPFGYIVVDETDTIVFASMSSTINFENLPAGNLRVFAVSYIGQFIATVGDNYLTGVLGSFCHEVSQNFIAVTNATPDGGLVATDAGETAITVCISEDADNTVVFQHTSTFEPFLYVITTEDNIILGASTDGVIDFGNADPGICRVWGLAYVGNYIGQPGDDITSTLLATACFDLSDNFVTVNRLFPEAGSLTFSDGTTSYTSCSELEPSGSVLLSVTGANPATAFTFVMVDNANQMVAAIFDNSSLNLATTPTGSYTIYGVAYTGNLALQVGATFNPELLSDECADLSNGVTFVKRVQNADDIRLADGAQEITICSNDGVADPLTFTTTYTGNDNFVYLVANPGSFLLDISTSPVIDFEGTGVGEVHVWGLAYSGNLTVTIGDNIGTTALSDECYDLSDGFVLVRKDGPNGGVLSYADGTTSYLSCTPFPFAGEAIPVVAGNDVGSFFTFLVVNDANNQIVQLFTESMPLDVEFLPNGNYTVYGVSHVDVLSVGIGGIFDPSNLSSACIDLSDNTLSLIKDSEHADDVLLADGSQEVIVCTGDGNADVLNFTTTYTGSDNFIYILTTVGSEILAFSTDATFDLEPWPAGNLRVWGMAYTGNVLVAEGQNLGLDHPLTDGCYDLSDGYVLVIRNQAAGGTIALEDGSTSYTACQAFDAPATLGLVASGAQAGLPYAYIVVDASTGLVASVLSEPSLFLGSIPLGTYQVYGVSYHGNLTVAVGDAFAAAVLADVCYDLSDNAVNIVNKAVNVDQITLEDGSAKITLCLDDNQSDVLAFDTDFGVGQSCLYRNEHRQ